MAQTRQTHRKGLGRDLDFSCEVKAPPQQQQLSRPLAPEIRGCMWPVLFRRAHRRACAAGLQRPR